MLISNQQCQLQRNQNAIGARRTEFPRSDDFRDTNDVDFMKDIAKILRRSTEIAYDNQNV